MDGTTGRCLAAGCMVVVAVASTNGAAWAGTVSQPSPVQKAAPAQIQQAPTTVTPAVAPSTGDTIHLTIAGIAGDGPGGKIVCRSFRTGQTATRDAAAGKGSGKIKFNEFTITKTTDASSPAFMRARRAGQVFPSAVFEFFRAQADAKGVEKTSKGKPVKYLEIKLTNVMVSSVRQVGSGDVPLEEITFTAQKLERK